MSSKEILTFLSVLNPFNTRAALKEFHDQVAEFRKELRNIADANVAMEKLVTVYDELEKYKNMLDTIGASIPDMLWAKDINGKYIYANNQIITNLLFTGSIKNTIGRTDKELALERKNPEEHYESYTFTDLCSDSDSLVIKANRPMTFIEWGKVSGKDIILKVHKNVMKNGDGLIIGTVGLAIDITEDYSTLKMIADNTTDDWAREEIIKYMDKYKFEEFDNG